MPKPRKSPIQSDTKMLGKNVQTYRKKRGLVQKELAEKIGVTREAVAAYESGRGRMVDVTLIDIAKALSVSTDELLGIKMTKSASKDMSLRLIKRMNAIDALPEPKKKHVLKVLDDTLKANSRA